MRKNINLNDVICKKVEENARVLGLDATTEFNQTLLYGITARTKLADKQLSIMKNVKASLNDDSIKKEEAKKTE